jgi:hypothetical protein
MKNTNIVEAQADSDLDAAQMLFQKYAADIGVDLRFQNFSDELERPGNLLSSSGCLLLSCKDGKFVGCVGLRLIAADVCEMKRLYVQSASRGSIGTHGLPVAVIEKARSAGYRIWPTRPY